MTADDIEKYLDKIVVVDWDDIVCSAGWIGSDDILKEAYSPAAITSIGWLSGLSEEYIVVSATRGVDEHADDAVEFNQHISIPIGCIKSVTQII